MFVVGSLPLISYTLLNYCITSAHLMKLDTDIHRGRPSSQMADSVCPFGKDMKRILFSLSLCLSLLNTHTQSLNHPYLEIRHPSLL